MTQPHAEKDSRINKETEPNKETVTVSLDTRILTSPPSGIEINKQLQRLVSSAKEVDYQAVLELCKGLNRQDQLSHIKNSKNALIVLAALEALSSKPLNEEEAAVVADLLKLDKKPLSFFKSSKHELSLSKRFTASDYGDIYIEKTFPPGSTYSQFSGETALGQLVNMIAHQSIISLKGTGKESWDNLRKFTNLASSEPERSALRELAKHGIVALSPKNFCIIDYRVQTGRAWSDGWKGRNVGMRDRFETDTIVGLKQGSTFDEYDFPLIEIYKRLSKVRTPSGKTLVPPPD